MLIQECTAEAQNDITVAALCYLPTPVIPVGECILHSLAVSCE